MEDMTMEDCLQKVLVLHNLKIHGLQKELAALKDELSCAKKEHRELKSKNSELERENKRLFSKGKHYSKECDELKITNAELVKKLKELESSKVKEELCTLLKENNALKADNAKLKRLKDEYDQVKAQNDMSLKSPTNVMGKLRVGGKFLGCAQGDNASVASQSVPEQGFTSKILSLEKAGKRTRYQQVGLSSNNKRQRTLGRPVSGGVPPNRSVEKENCSLGSTLGDPDETRLTSPVRDNASNGCGSHAGIVSSTPKNFYLPTQDRTNEESSATIASDSEIIPCSPVFTSRIHNHRLDKTQSPTLFDEEDQHSMLLLEERHIPDAATSFKRVRNKNFGLDQSNNSGTFKKPPAPNKSRLSKFDSKTSLCLGSKSETVSDILPHSEEIPMQHATVLQCNGSIDPGFCFSQFRDTQSLQVDQHVDILCPETVDSCSGQESVPQHPYSGKEDDDDVMVISVEETRDVAAVQNKNDVNDVSDDEELSQVLIGGDQCELNKPAVSSSMEDSFDRVVKPAGASYAYVDVVRRQDERQKLPAYSCKQCFDYYNDGTLTTEQIHEKMKAVCKHRATYVPPGTPEGFFNLGFPETLSSVDDSITNLPMPRRRKRLQKRID